MCVCERYLCVVCGGTEASPDQNFAQRSAGTDYRVANKHTLVRAPAGAAQKKVSQKVAEPGNKGADISARAESEDYFELAEQIQRVYETVDSVQKGNFFLPSQTPTCGVHPY